LEGGLKLAELEKELAKQHIRPAYLLAGEEPLLRDDALAAIRRAVLGGSADDGNYARLAGETVTAGVLQDAARALPVMAEHRLVVLAEPERRRGAAGKTLTDALADVVTELGGQRETVLVVSASKADKRSRWVKAFAEPSVRVECDAPKPGRALLAFIDQEARRQALELEDGCAALLAERIGPQLLVLRQELGKAALLAGPGEPVMRLHVEASSSAIAEQPVWDLTDAIGTGRVAEAISLLSRITAAGAAPQQVLATLVGHFRKLAVLRAGGDVAGHPYMVKKLKSQAGRYSQKALRECLSAIHETDLALKGMGRLSPQLALEHLVIDLTG
jgi:DNA polymerase-3 subunit delta